MQEKKAKIVWAEGEAQAIKDVGERIGTNYAYLDLIRIQKAMDVAKILGQSRNRVFLSSDTLLLNLHDPLMRDSSTLQANEEDVKKRSNYEKNAKI